MDETAAPTGFGSEEILVAALRANDAKAYEHLVRQNLPRLLAVASRILGNDADAQDAAQDAFVSAFKAIADFDGESRLATWLHRIGVNAALMKLRSRKRRPERPIEALLPRFLEDGHHADTPSPWPDAQELLSRRETRERVRAAIDRLPESYRTVLLLRDIEEMDTAETARLLQVSDGVVKTRLHRARQALRALLDPVLRGDLE